jgi:predicted dehydrogenase
MLDGELRLPTEQRVDFISIATPNDMHFAMARAFAGAGFHVLCDKPMTFDLAQAEELAEVVGRSGVIFAVAYCYTGYPLIRLARDLVSAGELGTLHAVRATYLQSSLYRQRTPEQQRRFAWKNDPERAGPSGCFGDIGIHAFNLVRFTTGLIPVQLTCNLRTFASGARLDDYGAAVLFFSGGALGTITASRVSHGRENDLRLEIDGSAGSLEWHQQEPNRMWFRVTGQPQRLYTRHGVGTYTTETARLSCRLPAGHPEGYLEAFANLYAAVFDDIVAQVAGRAVDRRLRLYADVQDGVEGMRFIDRCLASSGDNGTWKRW